MTPARRAALVLVACGALPAGCSAGGLDVIDVDPRSLGDGLLAHWSFDEGTGNVLIDHSRNGHHDGAILGATWIPGQTNFKDALHFAAGEVSVPDFQQPTASWSVAGWVRPPAGDFGGSYLTLISTEVVLQGGWQMNVRLTPATPDMPAGSIYQFAYWIGPGESDYVYYDCQCVVVNQWTHLAGVVDRVAGKLLFYQDGVLKGEMAAPADDAHFDMRQGSPTLYLARWAMDTQRNLTGDLDDFVVYNRALAPQEIAMLARAALPPSY